MYNFPNSPAVDDTFSPPGGPTWTWNGTGWVQTGSVVGPEGPEGPAGPAGPEGPPGSTTWADITGKPSTFPPTVPIDQFNITNLITDLALKAPITNAGLLGIPTAPTPSLGVENTQIANTEWVQGTLELQIAGREPAISAGTDEQYWRGDKTWQTLPITTYGTHYGYLFNTSSTPPPAAGGMRFNTSAQSSVTSIYLSFTDENGVNLQNYFDQRVKPGDTVYIQDRDEPAKWQLYEITAPFTNSGTYATIPVAWLAGGAAITGQRVIVSRESAGTAGTVGEAPSDGTPYARQDAAWVAAPTGGGADWGVKLTYTWTDPDDIAPATGHAKTNNAGSEVWIDWETADEIYPNAWFNLFKPGHRLVVQNTTDAGIWAAYLITSVDISGTHAVLTCDGSATQGDAPPSGDDSVWIYMIPGNGFVVGTTAPPNPAVNDVWIDTT